MRNQNGLILWEGPSAIDGEPIVVIATGLKTKSTNGKIGPDTVQVWYLPRDVAPHVAAKTGADASVCGDCKHRPSTGGACYVVTFQAPLAIWKAYHRGSYPTWNGSTAPFDDRVVRFGAWGDPAAVPAGLLASIRDESPVSEVMDCGKCSGCDGLARGAKRPSYAIIVHGGKASRFGVQGGAS